MTKSLHDHNLPVQRLSKVSSSGYKTQDCWCRFQIQIFRDSTLWSSPRQNFTCRSFLHWSNLNLQVKASPAKQSFLYSGTCLTRSIVHLLNRIIIDPSECTPCSSVNHQTYSSILHYGLLKRIKQYSRLYSSLFMFFDLSCSSEAKWCKIDSKISRSKILQCCRLSCSRLVTVVYAWKKAAFVGMHRYFATPDSPLCITLGFHMDGKQPFEKTVNHLPASTSGSAASCLNSIDQIIMCQTFQNKLQPIPTVSQIIALQTRQNIIAASYFHSVLIPNHSTWDSPANCLLLRIQSHWALLNAKAIGTKVRSMDVAGLFK